MFVVAAGTALNARFDLRLGLEVYGTTSTFPADMTQAYVFAFLGTLFSVVGWVFGNERLRASMAKNRTVSILLALCFVASMTYVAYAYVASVNREILLQNLVEQDRLSEVRPLVADHWIPESLKQDLVQRAARHKSAATLKYLRSVWPNVKPQ